MQHWQASFTWLSWLSWLVIISFRAHSHLYAWDSNNAKPSAWWLLDNASFTLKVGSPINCCLMINNSNRTSVSNKKEIVIFHDISSLGLGLYRIWPDNNLIAQKMTRFPPQSRIPAGYQGTLLINRYTLIYNQATSGCWQEVTGNSMTISIITWMIFDGLIIINPITNSLSHAKQAYGCLVGNLGIIQSITIIIQSSNPPFRYV